MRLAAASLGIAVFLSAAPSPARALNVGDKASEFKLKTAFGKVYTLASFKSPVLLVWYEGAKSQSQNRWLREQGKRLRDSGVLDTRYYTGIGIANFSEHWASNWLIRQFVKQASKKYATLILCDEDKRMQRLWGFRNGRSNIYVFDQNRVLRWKSSGPLTKRRGRQLWRLVVRLIKQYRRRDPKASRR